MCEDWPCCGHEAGCCPTFDATGRQLDMRCVCGASVPLGSRYSICAGCMNAGVIEEEVIDTSEGPSDIPEYDNEDAYNPMYGKRFDDPNHPINTGD